jgi:hypothetical protein
MHMLTAAACSAPRTSVAVMTLAELVTRRQEILRERGAFNEART